MAARISISPLGALVGGAVGAVVRPAAVYLHVGEHLQKVSEAQTIYTGSFVIGLFVGVLAGLVGRPLVGAIVGGILAVMMYYFSIIPLIFCLCLASFERQQGGPEPPAWWLIAFTGAIAGGSGGLAEYLGSRNRAGRQSRDPGGSADPDPAADDGDIRAFPD